LAIDDSMNFRLLEECSSNELIPTIHSSLRWLQGILKRRGEQLSAGQIILTGSIASLIPIQGSCYIRVDIPPFGSVEASFVT
jgi:2-keto-4-pentenoate hydratase